MAKTIDEMIQEQEGKGGVLKRTTIGLKSRFKGFKSGIKKGVQKGVKETKLDFIPSSLFGQVGKDIRKSASPIGVSKLRSRIRFG